MIYEKYANAKYKYRYREFWCIWYYIDIAGKNTYKIKEHISNQLKEYGEADYIRNHFFISNVW